MRPSCENIELYFRITFFGNQEKLDRAHKIENLITARDSEAYLYYNSLCNRAKMSF